MKVTLREISTALGTEPSVLRRWLRQNYPHQSGNRWSWDSTAPLVDQIMQEFRQKGSVPRAPRPVKERSSEKEQTPDYKPRFALPTVCDNCLNTLMLKEIVPITGGKKFVLVCTGCGTIKDVEDLTPGGVK